LFALILIGLVWQEHIGPVSGFFLIGVALLLTGAIIYVWRRRAADAARARRRGHRMK
jgi:hypothetical protein